MSRLRLSPQVAAGAIGAFVVVAAALGIWWAASGSNGSSKPATTRSTTAAAPATGKHPTRLSHRQYALLYLHAIVHKTQVSVLAQWPTPPYQHYTVGNQTCYEWWDKPIALYNLCFVHGVLTLKAIE